MFNKIQTKVVCMLFLTLAIVVTCNFVIINRVLRSSLTEAFKAEGFATGQGLKAQVESLLSYGLEPENKEGFDKLCTDVIKENTDIVFAGVVDLEGNMLFSSKGNAIHSIKEIPKLYEKRGDPVHSMVSYKIGEEEFLGFIFPVLNNRSEHIGSVILEYRAESVLEGAKSISKYNLGVSILMFTVAVMLITIFLSIWVMRPIRKLYSATREIFYNGPGSITTVNINSKDELGRLGKSFNLMVSKLRDTTVTKDFVDNIISSMTEALIVVRPDNTVDMVNEAAISLFEYNEKELIGKKVTELIESEEIFWREFRNDLIKSQDHKSYDTMAITKRREKVDIRLYCSLMKSEGNGEHHIVCTVRDITETKKTDEIMFKQANYDNLTNLPNRHYLERKLNEVIVQNTKSGVYHCYLALDLDKFKVVNDVCGHHAGDQLLKHISFMMKKELRQGDFIARVGGDEFSILLPNTKIKEAVAIGEKICKVVKDFNFSWDGKMFAVGVSVGAVEVDDTMKDTQWMLSAADRACYICKEKGGNKVQIFDKDNKELVERHEEVFIMSSITKALEENQFFLIYQPIVSCVEEDETIWFEVLIRMLDDSGKVVAPGSFLSAAQRYNMMPSIDKWVVHHFLSNYEDNVRNTYKGKKMRFNINLSGGSLNADKFLDFVKKELDIYDVPPEVICFEVTETCAVSNFIDASNFITELKKIGCNFALDDFGSGFSSFTYIKYLPVDYIKIDGAFVKDINKNKVDYAMVSSINEIAHLLGKKTIGEFVENEEVYRCIREIGVDYGQGYWIGKPNTLEFYKG